MTRATTSAREEFKERIWLVVYVAVIFMSGFVLGLSLAVATR